LHGYARGPEHREFLDWLRRALLEHAVDVLLIAGDVFDSANPSAQALEMFYGFLAELRREASELEIVVIAGNHDSAARLDAPRPVLRSLGVHVVGALPEDPGELVVPLRVGGRVAARAVCVPFLRPADLPAVEVEQAIDPLIEGVRQRYLEAIELARAQRQPGEALIATGHLYMVGGQISELSERRVLGGNQHPLPVDIFPDDIAYAALGHLHKAQRVGGREGVRYSGAPLPLSLSEARYRHQVLLVDFAGEELKAVESLVVPRAAPMVRIPKSESAPLDAVLEELAALPDESPGEHRPYLEVAVMLETPIADLRDRIEAAIADKEVRLCKIGVSYTGDRRDLAELHVGERLADLQPEDVLLRRYRRDYEGDPPAELVALFHDVVDAVSRGAS
jgi:exonuclease SbcD